MHLLLDIIAIAKRIAPLLPENIIAIDGKSLCNSKRANACKKALHIINAWSCANSICLGQLKVDDKSNEIPAVPELLKLLYLRRAVVTLNAMGAKENTVKTIIKVIAQNSMCLPWVSDKKGYLPADLWYSLMIVWI